MRFATWLIAPDRTEGAPPEPVHEIECTTCAGLESADPALTRSPATYDIAEAQTWALQHSGRNPTHTGYREIVTRFWRTSMVDDGRR